jgi:hypothetical protein
MKKTRYSLLQRCHAEDEGLLFKKQVEEDFPETKLTNIRNIYIFRSIGLEWILRPENKFLLFLGVADQNSDPHGDASFWKTDPDLHTDLHHIQT